MTLQSVRSPYAGHMSVRMRGIAMQPEFMQRSLDADRDYTVRLLEGVLVISCGLAILATLAFVFAGLI